MKFQDNISNLHTHTHTHTHTRTHTHAHMHIHTQTSQIQYVPHFFKVGGIIILLDTDFERKHMVKLETLFNEQFQWKVVHNAIFIEKKMFLMNMSNGLCHFCKANTET